MKCSRLLGCSLGAVTFCVTIGVSPLFAQVLPVSTCDATPDTSDYYEASPTLGAFDGIEVLAYTRRPALGDGMAGMSEVFYRQILPDVCTGEAVRVSEEPLPNQNDLYNDIFERYIVYTTSQPSQPWAVKLYDIESGVAATIPDTMDPRQARIHGNKVVWADRDALKSFSLWMCEFDETLACSGRRFIANINTFNFTFELGDRFLVWSPFLETYTGSEVWTADVYAYDLTTQEQLIIAASDLEHESQPTTSGPWIVWVAQSITDELRRIEALNIDTGEHHVVIDDGADNGNPTASGDLLAFDSNVSGNYDIWIHRFSEGDVYQVTTDPLDQRITSVVGNRVAYIDKRGISSNIYLADVTCAWPEQGGDDDGDLVCSASDNCPTVYNPEQQDGDGDTLGDACDPCPLDAGNDADGDGVCGEVDNCPAVANPDQQDSDGDTLGDVCDPCPLDPENGADGDGVCGEEPVVTCSDGEPPDLCGDCMVVELVASDKTPQKPKHHGWWWRFWSWFWPERVEGDAKCLCRQAALVVPRTLAASAPPWQHAVAELVFTTEGGEVTCRYERPRLWWFSKAHDHKSVVFAGCTDKSLAPLATVVATEVRLDVAYGFGWFKHHAIRATVSEAGEACGAP